MSLAKTVFLERLILYFLIRGAQTNLDDKKFIALPSHLSRGNK